jgi:hypothetical protein
MVLLTLLSENSAVSTTPRNQPNQNLLQAVPLTPLIQNLAASWTLLYQNLAMSITVKSSLHGLIDVARSRLTVPQTPLSQNLLTLLAPPNYRSYGNYIYHIVLLPVPVLDDQQKTPSVHSDEVYYFCRISSESDKFRVSRYMIRYDLISLYLTRQYLTSSVPYC